MSQVAVVTGWRPGATTGWPPDAGERTALVIGAGLGGLASAIRLRHGGYRVTVVERASHPGGRCGLWESEGFRFDTGPTLLLMVDQLRALFADVGRRLEDYLDLVQLEPSYQVRYPDGRSLEVTSRLNEMLAGLERIEPGVTPRFLRFLSEAARLYRVGLDGFVNRNVHRPQEFFTLRNAGLLLRSRGAERLQTMVARFFTDPLLRATFSFQSLYLGLSPYESPAIYGLLPYTEVAGGLYFPRGGMHAIPRALARLAGELGVRLVYDTDVVGLDRDERQVTAAVLPDGARLAADLVVANADLPSTYARLLGEPYPRIDRLAFSCSAFLMYLGVGRTYPALRHHTLVMPPDFRGACDDIFHQHRIPAEPPYYLCAPSRTDPSLAPPGCENLYVLVPVPSQQPGNEIDWAEAGPRLEEQTLERLERLGLPELRRRLITRRTFTPEDFRGRFSATRGEAFGLAHGLDQVGWFRPHNRHSSLRNLYFVGQSTHPGCGIPMVLISARLVVGRIAEEQGA
jgi:phytoene desaturase